MLETVRAFAGDQLEAAGEAELVRARLVAWMLDWAASTRQQLEGPDPAPAYADLAREEANIRAAYAACRDGGADRSLVRLVGAFGPFGLGSSGVVAEVDEWIDRALAVEGTPPGDRLQVLLLAARRLDRPNEVLAIMAKQALDLAVDVGDVLAQSVRPLGPLGGAHLEEGSAGAALLEGRRSRWPSSQPSVLPQWVLGALANVLLRRRGARSAGSWKVSSRRHRTVRAARGQCHLPGGPGRADGGRPRPRRSRVRGGRGRGYPHSVTDRPGVRGVREGNARFRPRGPCRSVRCYDESLAMDTLVDPGVVSQDQYLLVKVCLAQGDVEAARGYAAAMEFAAELSPARDKRERRARRIRRRGVRPGGRLPMVVSADAEPSIPGRHRRRARQRFLLA